jgi:2,3-dihydroxybenzoate decarboxylase
MQGKIALEEHFAIEPTLGDSQVFGAHVWKDLRHRLLDIQDTRLGEMDKYGIEIMILSLNAPAIQAIHDVAHAGSRRGHHRTHALYQGVRHGRRAGQRLFADRLT